METLLPASRRDGEEANATMLDTALPSVPDVTERHGTAHLLFNNAGIGPLAPVAALTKDDWR